MLAINNNRIDKTCEVYGIPDSNDALYSAFIANEQAMLSSMLNDIPHIMIYSRVYVSSIIW
jgi:DNA-binding transcriptional regulator GbsR (MarR family)